MKFDVEMYVLVSCEDPAIDARNPKQAMRRVRDRVNLDDLVNQKAFRRDVEIEKHSRFYKGWE